jgi:hypothetical protein
MKYPTPPLEFNRGKKLRRCIRPIEKTIKKSRQIIVREKLRLKQALIHRLRVRKFGIFTNQIWKFIWRIWDQRKGRGKRLSKVIGGEFRSENAFRGANVRNGGRNWGWRRRRDWTRRWSNRMVRDSRSGGTWKGRKRGKVGVVDCGLRLRHRASLFIEK